MTRCPNTRFGPRCERADEHDGCHDPHRNGTMVWHDPPLILVGGKPVPPLTEREKQLLASVGGGDSTRPLAVEGAASERGTSGAGPRSLTAPDPEQEPLLSAFALGETAFRGPDDPFPEGF